MQWLNSEQVLDLLKSLIWPVVVLIVFFTLMVPLSSALKGSDVSDIQVGTSGVSLSFDKKRLENVEPTEGVEVKSFLETVLLTSISIEELDD